MTTYFGRSAWTLWWQGLLAVILLVVAGAIAVPQLVYEGFIWEYLWGPVVADGRGLDCVAYAGGAEVPCIEAPAARTTAEPGYTTVSTVTYALVLLAFLVGIYLGFERFDIEPSNRLYFAFVPFVFFGGAARALEDATLLANELDVSGAVLSFPLTAVLISPLIYFFIFFLAAATLAGALALSRRGRFDTHEWPIAAVGTALLVGSLGYLVYLVWLLPTTISLAMFVLTLSGATAITAALWWGLRRSVPEIDHGTGRIGPIIVWGHSVDGIANVLSLDWNDALGLGRTYDAKHVVNAAVGDITEAIQPEALTDLIGSVWPFIPLKVAIATIVVFLFNDELREDSPRFFLVMLIAVLAVGLGPGTRDLLRATVGI